jgi:predicted nucleic acid-binding protein
MVIDACVWVGYYVAEDAHHQASYAWFTGNSLGQAEVAIPVIATAEVAGAVARRTGQPDLGHRAANEMLAFPGLRAVPIDALLARQAVTIAADMRLRGADAIYVALAAQLAAPLITFDDQLASRAAPLVQVVRP